MGSSALSRGARPASASRSKWSAGLGWAAAGAALATALAAVGHALAGRELPVQAVEATPWRTHAGAVHSDAPFVQRVRADPRRGLRVELALAPLGDARGGALELRLRRPGAALVLAVARAVPEELPRTGAWVRFDLPPVALEGASDGERELELVLAPADGAERAPFTPFVRFRGHVGRDDAWGERPLDVRRLEGELTPSFPNVCGVALALLDDGGAPSDVRLRLFDARTGEPLRSTRLPASERVDEGWAFFCFETIAESRFRPLRYVIELPPGARALGNGAEPSLKCFHGTSARAGADRDLVFRVFAPGARSTASRALDALGARRAIFLALAWIAVVALALRLAFARSPRRPALGLGALALAQAALFQCALPPWMGEDEAWQLEAALYVARGHLPGRGEAIEPSDWSEAPYSQMQARRRFPDLEFRETAEVERELLDSMARERVFERVDWAERWMELDGFDAFAPAATGVNHPPFAMLAAGALLRPFRALDPAWQLALARGLSSLSYVATVLLAFACARRALPSERAAVAAVLALALHPVVARHAAVFGGDAPAMAAGAFVLYLALRVSSGEGGRGMQLALGAIALGSLAIKTTCASSPAVAGAALWKRRGARARAWILAAGVLVFAVALFAWHREHSTVVPRELAALSQRVERSLDPATWREFARSAVGSFGWGSRSLPVGLAASVLAAALLGLAGLPRALRRAGFGERLALRMALFAAVVQFALLLARGVALARYLLPAAAALAVLWTAGFVALFRERPRETALRALPFALLVYESAFVFGGLLVEEWARVAP